MKTLKTQLGIAIALFFLVLGALILDAKAEEPCKTPEALSHLQNVKNNQPVISGNRDIYNVVTEAIMRSEEVNPDDLPSYNLFVRNKAWNRSESDALHKLGCQIDWKTLELVPVTNSQVSISSVKEANQLHGAAYDLDKLAKAVAMHETKDCGVNVGSALVNNCFGIRGWDKNGKPYFKKYATKEDSYKDFKRIWSTYYGQFPNTALAKKYSGNDRPQSWLANVSHYYETL